MRLNFLWRFVGPEKVMCASSVDRDITFNFGPQNSPPLCVEDIRIRFRLRKGGMGGIYRLMKRKP